MNRLRQEGRQGVLPIMAIMTVFLTFMTACTTGAKGGQPFPPPPLGNNTAKVAIGNLLAEPSKFMTKELVIEGVFKGWKGKCEASAFLTRSDWILEDTTGCIYVTGKIPDQVAPNDPKGETLTVRGALEIHPNGKPYFKAESVTR